jgi:hypothetical protein
MPQRSQGKPFPLLPFGFPEKRSLETAFFITLRKVKTYGVVAAWFFGHQGASLLLVAQTVEGPWRQFSIPDGIWEADVPHRSSRREMPANF